jgi:RadC-like JAB domain
MRDDRFIEWNWRAGCRETDKPGSAGGRWKSTAKVTRQRPTQHASPSPEDVAFTRQLVTAGELLDIEVLDHIVLGAGQEVSMRERGLGFAPTSGTSAGWRAAETQPSLYRPRRKRRKEASER